MSKQTKKTAITINVPEIKLTYDSGNFVTSPNKVTYAKHAVEILRSLYDKEEIELHEIMFVLFLNRANKPIGFYKHSIGGNSSTVVDKVIILAAALKSLSACMILSHNHPSGNVKPSDYDLSITRDISRAADLLGIKVIDHIIMTKDTHLSFGDDGLMGLPAAYPDFSERLIGSGLSDIIPETEKTALEIERELRKL